MRFVSLFAVLATSTALSGCAGGDGSALSLAVSGPVCGVNAGNCATPAPTPAPVTTNVTPPPPPPNTGNNATVATGDGTIALEEGVIVSTKPTPALSKLTLVAATGSTPATAKIEIDTKSVNKALWPTAKTMDEYAFGTATTVGGLGASSVGGNYKEYRSYSRNSAGTAIDEELQVWSFNHSYVTQYRDVTKGGAPATHQAWSFGGTKTPAAAMVLKGSGTYTGKWGATAVTSNYIDSKDPSQTLSHNWHTDTHRLTSLGQFEQWSRLADSPCCNGHQSKSGNVHERSCLPQRYNYKQRNNRKLHCWHSKS
jgi:hypothetical protein